jgi:hypothetical protein
MRKPSHAALSIMLLPCGLLVARPVTCQVDVLTQRYDSARSGANLKETVLKKSNVNKEKFGKLAFRIVDGNIYAQPLIVSQAKVVNHPTPVNVAVVATEHNSVYAFDADDTTADPSGQESGKALWHTGPASPQSLGQPIESTDLYPRIKAFFCADLTTEIGITGTPVIKLTRETPPKEGVIWVTAKAKNGEHFTYNLFALNLADGKPVGSGVEIEGDVASPSGTIHFDPLLQLNRPALLLDHDILYIAFGGHCDTGDYRGWVFAYDVSDPSAPQKKDVFATTFTKRQPTTDDKEGRAGIWMSGYGLATDGDGGIYFATGDGTYNLSDPSFPEFGNSVVKVKFASGKIQVQDWYAPQNRDDLKKLDTDLGSGGAVPVPNSHLLLAGGKEGRLYVIDRNDMGRGTKPSLHSFQVTNLPLKRVANPTKAGDVLYWNIHGAPVIWPREGHMFVYVMGEEDRLKQYRLIPDAGSAAWKFEADAPFKKSKESVAFPNPPHGLFNDPTRNMIWMPGGFLTLSANGTDKDTGIIWATMPFNGNANHEVVRGVLRAFDASDVSKGQLWSTEDSGNPADRLGMFAKFNPPVVANGKVYVATFQEERMDNGVHMKAEGGDQPALVIYGEK